LRHSLAVVMCDIDHFKRINDRYGHQTGDEVLQEFSDRLTHGLRREDWVARIGGEEFAVVLPEAGDVEARAIAQRLCDGVAAKAFVTSSHSIAVTASFGVCALDAQRVDSRGLSDALVKAADAALYQSKRDGRNRVTAATFRAVEPVPKPVSGNGSDEPSSRVPPGTH
jgi:two-component system cell cycle response regulator